MIDHHIQRSILYHLALADSLRVSQLNPDIWENKLFSYHLKKVVAAGYVKKQEDGTYTLTSEGRRLGLRAVQLENTDLSKPHSVLFLVVRRATDQAWLLYRRSAHPLKDKVGFMHAVPEADVSVLDTASRILKEKTGLSGKFHALGGGYFRIYQAEQLESFTHFTLLVCEDAIGELLQHHEHADGTGFPQRIHSPFGPDSRGYEGLAQEALRPLPLRPRPHRILAFFPKML